MSKRHMDFTPRGNQGTAAPTPARRSVPVAGSRPTSTSAAAISGASARRAAASSVTPVSTRGAASSTAPVSNRGTAPAPAPVDPTPVKAAPRPRLSSALSGTARRAVNSVARKKTANFRAGAYGAFTAAGSPKNGASYGVARPTKPQAPLGMPVDASDYSEITEFAETVAPEPTPKRRIGTRGPRLLTKTRARRAPAPQAPPQASAAPDPTDFSDLGRLAQEIAEIEDDTGFIETATELEIKPAPKPKPVAPTPRRRVSTAAASAARAGAAPTSNRGAIPVTPVTPASTAGIASPSATQAGLASTPVGQAARFASGRPQASANSIPVTSFDSSNSQIPQATVSPRISTPRSSFSLTSGDQPFTLNSDPHFGVVENFQPKFLKTEVEKRPLSSSAPADTAPKPSTPVSKTADLAAKSQMRIPHPQFGGSSRLKRRTTAAKNPYPPNPALSRAAKAVAPEASSPVKVVKNAKKSNKIGAFLAVLGTIILGAAVGTIAFLLLPR